MYTHVAKWGASCAIRLPKMAVESLGLHEGQPISLNIEDGKLILQKEAPRYNLDDLVAQMEGKEQPKLEFDDDPIGDEFI